VPDLCGEEGDARGAPGGDMTDPPSQNVADLPYAAMRLRNLIWVRLGAEWEVEVCGSAASGRMQWLIHVFSSLADMGVSFCINDDARGPWELSELAEQRFRRKLRNLIFKQNGDRNHED
jgi:hypothetical protein